MRSLRKALTQDGQGRRLSDPDAGPLFDPLFGDTAEPDDIETGTSYVLRNLRRTRLENHSHRLFSAVQLDLTIEDRFGKPVKPREWFVVPLQVIDEAVKRIRDGSITELVYDPHTARLVG